MTPPRTIQNASNIPLNDKAGMVPNMIGGMMNYFQPMTFTLVTQAVSAGFENSTGVEVAFSGVIMPHKPSQLEIKQQGERTWTWWEVYADPQLKLKTDDCVIYHEKQYRVMSFQDYRLYNYVSYVLIEDYLNAGPTV